MPFRFQVGLRLQLLGVSDIAFHPGEFFRRRTLGWIVFGLAVLERPHIGGAFLIHRVLLQIAQLVQQIGHFLLIRLRLFDLLNVVKGRILGCGGKFHLELGENKVDACACAEAAHAGDVS